MNIQSIIRRKLCVRVMLMAVALISIAGFDAKAEDIFSELNNLSHVESTYVSGRFAHNKTMWRSSYGNRAMNLSKGFSALYTYQCYSTESVKKARQILKDYIASNKNVELVMRSKQDGQEYMVYEKLMGDDMISQMVIWNCDGPNVCEVVVIDWDKGLKTTKNPYNSDSNSEDDSSSLNDALKGLRDIENLRNLDGLGRLEGLASLESLEELGTLGELGQLGELGAVLGSEIGSRLGEIFLNYDWKGMFEATVLNNIDSVINNYESQK